MDAAIVLAAGKGTRFASPLAKVMHTAAGKPLLGWVLDALEPLNLGRVIVVVGHDRETVDGYVAGRGVAKEQTVIQAEQLGTGHAVNVVAETGALDGVDRVVVLAGDGPAVTTESIRTLLDSVDGGNAAALLSANFDDPTGYGRIIRDGEQVTGIVEHRDATEEQLAITEVNVSMYAFTTADLIPALGQLDVDNAQGELYLTDTIGYLVSAGKQIAGIVIDPDEAASANDRAQLAQVEVVLFDRIRTGLMRSGVRMVDPATTYIEATVTIEPNATILPNTLLEGATSIAAGAVIGPNCRLTDTVVAEDAQVTYTVASGAEIGSEATVGPFTYLRPGAKLGVKSKAGGFVEVKKSTIGDGSKVPHLSYVGDTTIGTGVNLGAGTVTVNYDGKNKHQTIIEDGAFVGSDSMLVAPMTVGKGAFVAAGSTITEDVPADSLAIERAEARVIEGWAARRRAKQAAAEANQSSTNQ